MITNGEEMIMTLFVPENLANAVTPRRRAASLANPVPGEDGSMAKIPTSTQTSLWQRLTSHAEQRWPQIDRINTRYRAGFAYVDAVVDGETLRLCRLRYAGSANQWGFAISGQPRRLRRLLPSYRILRRHLRRSPRHRLRPLPQRPNRLAHTPDELTGATTSTEMLLSAAVHN